MRVPLSWLRDLAPVDADVDSLAARLHDLGLIVEAVHKPTPLEGVVVAEVIECRPIEGAKKVQLVVVDDGTGPREIMCGAFNFSCGDRVPLAVPGAKLPGGLCIDVREVRSLGITSYGMLCSTAELGAGEDQAGICILGPDAPLGAAVAPLLGLDDTVIELEITPNRPDCMGMVGVGREVAAAFDVSLLLPDCAVVGEPPSADTIASVSVIDVQRCPRYVAMVVEDVVIGPSPLWLVARLKASGVRSINNVVDVTNYVMLEWGQPLHAFDLDRLSGGTIVVRTAAAGESIVTLDDKQRKLDQRDLLICDGAKPVAIAGVMGGASSEVSARTTRILIESANFLASSVMQTSKRLGLRTESSARFERGTDPGVCAAAASRAAGLLAELAGGTVRSGVIDVRAGDVTARVLSLRPSRANRLLGTNLSGSEMAALLAGIEIQRTNGDSDSDHIAFAVPTWRVDVEREVDLVEEVGRLYGYNKIERTLPAGRDRVGGLTPAQRSQRRLRRAVLAAGVNEAQTTTFVSQDTYDRLGWGEPPRVVVLNPLQDENRYLRTSLIPNLLCAAAYNVARDVRSVRLAEIGTVFTPCGELLPRELTMLGVVYSGVDMDCRVHREGSSRPFDVYDVKGFLESVCEDLGVLLTLAPDATLRSELHPGRSSGVEVGVEVGGALGGVHGGSPGGVRVGEFGQLHPKVAAAFDLPEATIVAEIELAPLLAVVVEHEDRYVPVSQFPAATFDLAFVVSQNVMAGHLAAVLRGVGGELCRSVELFDVYRGPSLAKGTQSLAFEIVLQARDHTLTDDDVQAAIDSMVSAAVKACDAVLRGSSQGP